MTRLADITFSQAAELATRVLVVPVGSTEQHGPHLPLSTDADIAVVLAQRLSEARDDVVTAPLVSYGASGEHQSFAGTVSIGTAALGSLLIELGRSATCTWRRLLLLNAHGGNHEALETAVRTLRAEGRDVRAWSPSWPGDAHAGEVETSVMLALRPGAVRLALAAAGATEPIGALMGRLRADGVSAVSVNGVLGDPTGASASRGRELLAAAQRELGALLDGWA